MIGSLNVDKRKCSFILYIWFIQIGDESTVWGFSNKMLRVIYSQLNFCGKNFYILRVNVKDLLQGINCNVRDIIKADEMLLRSSDDDEKGESRA